MPTTLALDYHNSRGMSSNLEYNAANAQKYAPEWGRIESDYQPIKLCMGLSQLCKEKMQPLWKPKTI
jgi:hypothetical protein